MRNNPFHRVWFVDLSPDPSIKRRVVASSAYDVAGLNQRGPKRGQNVGRCIPDDTGYRFWIRAADAGEALYEAKRLAG